MKEHFYDIESLSNVFTLCDYHPEENLIDCYQLVDTEAIHARTTDAAYHDMLRERILMRNQNFDGDVRVFDLREEDACKRLAETFGASTARIANNPDARSAYDDYDPKFRLVCDTDPEYDEDEHAFMFGYNSYNYDTTMLADFFRTVFIASHNANGRCLFKPTTARHMRDFNNMLFEADYKDNMAVALTVPMQRDNYAPRDYQDSGWVMRKNMLMSGRHLDVARLNEKQRKVGLKRLLGMLGYQILESDKLGTGVDSIEDLDQLLELIAYNVSDVVNLRELFHQPFYQGQFSLKQGLLKTYPELIYERIPGQYKPNVDPHHVRRDRLTIDSSSAQFATKALCPYDHLSDIETVSYMYPSERKVAELAAQGVHIERVNVLEESRKFFYRNFRNYPDLCAEFDKVYDYYKAIEGKNFNASEFYRGDYGETVEDGSIGLPERLLPHKLSEIPKNDNCMFYYNADGTPSNCFITFSTGGIHGAEWNVARYRADMAAWQKTVDDMDAVREAYPDPLDLRRAKKIKLDGVERKWSEFIRSGMTIKKMEAMTADERREKCYRNPYDKRPHVFDKLDDGSLKLGKNYVFTSTGLMNHEDFTSYYPNMLRMLSAFWNDGLGVDRYGEIFDDKQRYGKLMKDKSLSEKDREFYAVKREGTKLILNSASGAGDTDFRSPIQMNNRIISMRIIGQLFTWRIGQAQTLKGASVTSTNTDGLYTVMEKKLNDAILAKESADIGVAIEPEPIYLVSKDTNNRLEMDPDTGHIVSASGGSLACRADTNPTKALSHPAIIDWALAEYLVVASMHYKGMSLDKPFDETIGRSILAKAKQRFEPAHLLRMFQNVLASSPGSINYIFATEDANPSGQIILQHYNRVFIVKDKTPGSVHLMAANAKVITPVTRAKRLREDERAQQHDPVARHVLEANGVDVGTLPMAKEAVVKNVTNVSPDWYMLVENHSLMTMSDARRDEILAAIDYDKYLGLLKNSYENNWRNKVPAEVAD